MQFTKDVLQTIKNNNNIVNQTCSTTDNFIYTSDWFSDSVDEFTPKTKDGILKIGKSNWNNPKSQIMDEVAKRQLNIIRLRDVLDPTRLYKTLDSPKHSRFFQIGTIVEGQSTLINRRKWSRK